MGGYMITNSSKSNSVDNNLGYPNINAVTIVDEPEENTFIYAWRDKQLKKLPYEEKEVKTGQKIKTFMTFVKKENVIIINVNKEQKCLTVCAGVLENNSLKKAENPTKFYASQEFYPRSKRYIHKVPVDNPVLFFSLDPEDFGEEIKPMVVIDETGKREKVYSFGKYVCAVGAYGNCGLWGRLITDDEDIQKNV